MELTISQSRVELTPVCCYVVIVLKLHINHHCHHHLLRGWNIFSISSCSPGGLVLVVVVILLLQCWSQSCSLFLRKLGKNKSQPSLCFVVQFLCKVKIQYNLLQFHHNLIKYQTQSLSPSLSLQYEVQSQIYVLCNMLDKITYYNDTCTLYIERRSFPE